MRPYLIVLLYLLDELVSARLPFSSGVFALALCALILPSASLPLRTIASVTLGFAVLLVAGIVGARLSGTPIGLFSLFTWLLLTLLWLTGASLRPAWSALVRPQAAAAGVATATGALLLSLAGLDLYSAIAGTSTNRGAGLFLEPSHLALYVVPLGLIAWQRQTYRPWLLLALGLALATRFSVTLVLMLALGLLIARLLPEPPSRRGRSIRRPHRVRSLWLTVVAAALLLAPLPIAVDGVPINEYITQRIVGLLLAPDDADTQNLSSLVVLQGLELAELSFVASQGLGVGLGNMSLSPAIVDQSANRSLINAITPDSLDLNLRDGGLLVSKVTAELGVFALGVAWLMFVYLRRLRAPAVVHLGYHAAMATLLLTLLAVRALPYFAAPTCLAIASLAATVHRAGQAGSTARNNYVAHEELRPES